MGVPVYVGTRVVFIPYSYFAELFGGLRNTLGFIDYLKINTLNGE